MAESPPTTPAPPPHEGFRALFGQSATPMMFADDGRRFTDANNAALQLLGTDLQTIKTLRIEDLSAPELRPLTASMWEEFIADGTMTGEYELVRPNGSRVMVQFNATANVAPGQHLTIFIRHEDVGLPTTAEGRTGRARGALSNRERQVLRLVAYGKSGPEIAETLGIAPDTVRVHVRNAMHKLGAKTRAQAIGIAMAAGEI
ncbi:MAG: LuxR C-terminal-related transcriptional regulator [Gaiellales bacterium]